MSDQAVLCKNDPPMGESFWQAVFFFWLVAQRAIIDFFFFHIFESPHPKFFENTLIRYDNHYQMLKIILVAFQETYRDRPLEILFEFD